MREVQERGAGEIVLNCMGSDGVRRGYDIEQLQRGARAVLRAARRVGRRGSVRALPRCVRARRGVDAALAASVFHSGAIVVRELKRDLRAAGIEVRP